ncbi:MAG: hypothetical protein WCJ11_05455 [Methylococcaceae bacterium]
MTLIEFAELLYDSELGTSLRESIYAYPIVEGIHLIGLAFSVGLLFFVDLRLLGLFLPNISVSALLHPLRPLILGSFAVTMVTGILLFVASASKIILLDVFFYKLIFIVLAGVNALWFELKWGKHVDHWEFEKLLPKSVQYAGGISLFLWSLVLISGRLIPYLNYK